MFLQQGGPGDCCLLSFKPAKSQNLVSERIGSTMAAVLYRPAFGESCIESQKSFWNSSNFQLYLLKVLPLAELVHLPLVAQLTTDSSMVGGNPKHDGGNPKHADIIFVKNDYTFCENIRKFDHQLHTLFKILAVCVSL